MRDKPAFEVFVDGKHIRIWSSGRTEGFGDGAVIVNRIPLLLNKRK